MKIKKQALQELIERESELIQEVVNDFRAVLAEAVRFNPNGPILVYLYNMQCPLGKLVKPDLTKDQEHMNANVRSNEGSASPGQHNLIGSIDNQNEIEDIVDGFCEKMARKHGGELIEYMMDSLLLIDKKTGEVVLGPFDLKKYLSKEQSTGTAQSSGLPQDKRMELKNKKFGNRVVCGNKLGEPFYKFDEKGAPLPRDAGSQLTQKQAATFREEHQKTSS